MKKQRIICKEVFLKSCPFCGSEARLKDCRQIFVVECTRYYTCGASMYGKLAWDEEPDTPEEIEAIDWIKIKQSAIDNWNKRAS